MGYEIPYVDETTEKLDLFRRSWEDAMKARIRMENRALDYATGEVRHQKLLDDARAVRVVEDRAKRRIRTLLETHVMYDWLEEAKTAGARTAVVLSAIKHPHRFPSQRCTEGCHLLPTFEPGEPCPVENTPEKGDEPVPCPGTVKEPRDATGCRSLWHYAGMYPVKNAKGNIRLAGFVKGQQSSHSVQVKTAIMMPQGIAEQFYIQGSRYADVYYDEKARLREKHPDRADGWSHNTAKVIAAKAWLGDLLVEWKKRVPLDAEGAFEIDDTYGVPVAA